LRIRVSSTGTEGAAMSISTRKFFCSWSGGKDSCLALYKAVKAGGVPALLLTMMVEDGERSRSHGLSLDILRAQAGAMGIPLVTRSASWATYEEVFLKAAREFAEQGIKDGVFGDIDLDDHREWCVRVCSEAGVQAHHPLWKLDRLQAVHEFLDAGFQAYIIAVKDGVGRSLLGRPFDMDAVRSMQALGIDPCGEQGEFHTVVTGGPLFSNSLSVSFGEPVLKGGYWFLDAKVE